MPEWAMVLIVLGGFLLLSILWGVCYADRDYSTRVSCWGSKTPTREPWEG